MLAAVALGAGLVLTACGGNGNDDAANSSGSTSSSASTAAATPAASDAAAPATNTPAAVGAAPTATPKPASGGSAPGICTAGVLKASVAPGSGAQSVGSSGIEAIKLTNTGSHTCTMHGFPGVDLVAGGSHWSLERKQTTSQTVTVSSGGSAYFGIDYMPYQSGSGQKFSATTMVVTPPNDTHQLTIPWGEQPLLDQSGATHPATYVEPVVGHNPALS
jgi:hypothetical protein